MSWRLSSCCLAAALIGVVGPRAHGAADTLGWEIERLAAIGGRATDTAAAVGFDAAGNVYVAGSTFSDDFPTRHAFFASTDTRVGAGFLAKYDRAGSLVYSTYLDGTPNSAAVGADGSVVVAGRTSGSDSLRPWISRINASGTGADFVVRLSTVRAAEARSVALDASGNVFVVGVVADTTRGFEGGDTQGFIAKIDPAGAVLSVASLGGSRADVATGVTVDAEGNAYVSGTTSSSDFPTTAGAVQRTMRGGFACSEPHPSFGLRVAAYCSNAFVAKLASNGMTILYSTLVGGEGGEEAVRIAVDGAGSAYIAGVTRSTDFPVTRAFQPDCARAAGGVCEDGFVAKLNPDGTALEYSTFLGGIRGDRIGGIVVNGSGEAYVAGQTTSSDFPVRSAFQRAGASGPVLKSTDGGGTWQDASRNIGNAGVWTIAAGQSGNQQTLYAAGGGVIFRSIDRGEHWTSGRLPIDNTLIIDLAVDPQSRSIVYAAGQLTRNGLYTGGLFKSVDAGATWTLVAERRDSAYLGVAVAPSEPSTVYVPSNNGTLYRSADGGSTLTAQGPSRAPGGRANLIVDLHRPTTLYAAGGGSFSKSDDGGRTWFDVVFDDGRNSVPCLARDPAAAATFYACGETAVFKTINSGVSWTRGAGFQPHAIPAAVVVDPVSPSTIFAATRTGLYRSVDGGATWTRTALRTNADMLLIDPVQRVLYAASVTVNTSAIVAKLDARGGLAVSTFVGTSGDAFTALALHADGRIAAVGQTLSADAEIDSIAAVDALVTILVPASASRRPRAPEAAPF